MGELVILSSVYQPYRWLAPLLKTQLDQHWPNHPRMLVAGLTPEEAGSLPALPVTDGTLPRNWCRFMREACETLRAQGVQFCYLVPEEHPPIAPCHVQHLNETLPRWMRELNASYIGLMGWDRRRPVDRGKPVGAAYPGLHDLRTARGPRFQLHPALWSLDALIACLDLILSQPKQSPWAFENNSRKSDAALPDWVKEGCYILCGAEMSATPPTPLRRNLRGLGHFIARRFVGLVYRLPRAWRRPLWDWAQLDHFFYNGPFPLFFGGVMTKGQINPRYLRHLERDRASAAANAPLIAAIRAQMLPEQRA
ncbi:MAG: hypothetical protein JWQ44_2711 [Chthoniobacter sp.]|nr:hypothetical protein [Chthoniobacter sp.]